MSQDGLAALEPAFDGELDVIIEWAFGHLQRGGDGNPDELAWLRDETGGSVYLRLSTNSLEQPGKRIDGDFRPGAVDGACWLRMPGPNRDVAIGHQGAIAPEPCARPG